MLTSSAGGPCEQRSISGERRRPGNKNQVSRLLHHLAKVQADSIALWLQLRCHHIDIYVGRSGVERASAAAAPAPFEVKPADLRPTPPLPPMCNLPRSSAADREAAQKVLRDRKLVHYNRQNAPLTT